MTELNRRTALGAAWSIPVIALAVAAPAAAASDTPPKQATCADQNGVFTIIGNSLVVSYKTAPDIYEVNVHYADGTSQSFGTNFGSAPAKGSTTWSIGLREFPAWVQVHSFNVHFGEPTCPVPA